MPGAPQSLTVRAKCRSLLRREPLKDHEKGGLLDDSQSLCHSKWECKYHVVWVPKGRRKALYGRIRQYLGELFHSLARQKECKILEGHLCNDHVHVLISIPPKYSVAQVIGFIKGKSAIHIARMYLGQKKNFTGMHFWARGYFVTTVGADEETVRNYIKYQEVEDKRLDQLAIFNEG